MPFYPKAGNLVDQASACDYNVFAVGISVMMDRVEKGWTLLCHRLDSKRHG